MRFIGTLFLCMALTLVACENGSDSDDKNDTSDTNSCEPGSTFAADDGCNTCTCPESGKVSEAACTKIDCGQSNNGCNDKQCGETCVTISDCPGVCDAESKCVCEGGELDCSYNPCAGKSCGDTCSTCDPVDTTCTETAEEKACNKDGKCDSSGAVVCEDMCEPGSTFAADDGCNTCTCPESGKVSEAACTKIGCPPYDPCQGKECGDTCSECDPADKECVETAVEKACNKAMECSADTGQADCKEEEPTLWYTSCGDPVCTGHEEQVGMELCDTETPGDPCSDEGGQCDPIDDCNSVLICATSDPKSSPEGCPKSRQATKTDIEYLDVDGLKTIHEELMAMRLAKWRYKNEVPTPKARLGFIIEDIEPSVAANSPRGQVDLYSFASMAVAAVQHQNKELAMLKKEVAALKKMLKELKSKK